MQLNIEHQSPGMFYPYQFMILNSSYFHNFIYFFVVISRGERVSEHIVSGFTWQIVIIKNLHPNLTKAGPSPAEMEGTQEFAFPLLTLIPVSFILAKFPGRSEKSSRAQRGERQRRKEIKGKKKKVRRGNNGNSGFGLWLYWKFERSLYMQSTDSTILKT